MHESPQFLARRIALFLRLCCFIACSLILNACFKPQYYGIDPKVEFEDLTYAQVSFDEGSTIREAWWEAYGDEGLNAALESVLNSNLSLQIAYYKLLEASYNLEQSRSEYWPSLSFQAAAGVGGSIDGEENPVDPSYQMGLSLGYEIDLWGKVRAEARVGELSYLSAQDAADAAILSLTSRFVLAWFDVQYYRARRVMVEDLLRISEDYLEMVERSYRLGQAAGVDVLEQQDQVRLLKLNLQKIDTSERTAIRQLNTLANRQLRIDVTARQGLAPIIEVGAIADPLSLIERRPDIKAALRSAQIADAKIVVALANRLPSLRLSASLNLRSTSITEFFSQLFWNIAGNFVANIFDGFRSTRNIDKAKAVFMQERLGYAITVIEAVSEVEEALHQYQQSRLDWEESQTTLTQSKDLLEVAKSQFLTGQIDYNRVLSALRAMNNASLASLDTHRTVLTSQVRLFNVMGGSWMQKHSSAGQERAREALEEKD